MAKLTDQFAEILDEMKALHARKDADYADDVPYRNIRASEALGIPAWKGVLIRMGDKWNRLTTFAKKESYEVKDENFVDTLRDMANYAVICEIMYRELQKVESD